jgi:hypothetical protein
MTTLSKCLAVSGVLALGALVGCNETTRKDVTAAQNKTQKEMQKLDEAKREEARTVNKPVIDQPNQREADRAHDKVANQEKRVADAKREEIKTEQDLNNEQSRDMFLIDCKKTSDDADRAIEKLRTRKNAATDEEKMAIDNQIEDIKAKRSALQTEINNVRTADIKRWSEYHTNAQKAMDDLKLSFKGL